MLFWQRTFRLSSLCPNQFQVLRVTHVLLYFTTSVPSAIHLFHNFSWMHGIFLIIIQLSYKGAYSLLMHQHIHVGGILKKCFALLDELFPYILDPLMGHTWNTFYWHHVKHHHVVGNVPNDLSSTIRFERDNLWHFCVLYCAGFLLGLARSTTLLPAKGAYHCRHPRRRMGSWQLHRVV